MNSSKRPQIEITHLSAINAPQEASDPFVSLALIMSAVSNNSFGLWTSYLIDAAEWIVVRTDSYAARSWVTLALCVLVYLVFVNNVWSSSSKDVYELRGLSLVHAWGFFYRRFDFIQEKFKESGGKPFQFKVLQVNVYIMRKLETVSNQVPLLFLFPPL